MDVEGSGRGEILGHIPEFAWRDWGKLLKISVTITCLRAEILTGDSRIRSRNANRSTETFSKDVYELIRIASSVLTTSPHVPK
jgi:hypothetical protein